MALIKCNECGQMVSDKAGSCPNCGAPICKDQVAPATQVTEADAYQPQQEGKRTSKKLKCIIGAVAVVVVVIIGYFVCVSLFGKEKDWSKEPLEVIMKAAEKGDAGAQAKLGFICYNEEEYADAVKWFRKAAEQGDANAQAMLGGCYHFGQGVPENNDEAAKWYSKSAKQGNALAQFGLAYCYYLGDGVPKNHDDAIKWLRKSAKQGYAPAQSLLGDCYYFGDGVPKNYDEAVKWYRKAAAQGDEDAQEALRELGL